MRASCQSKTRRSWLPPDCPRSSVETCDNWLQSSVVRSSQSGVRQHRSKRADDSVRASISSNRTVHREESHASLLVDDGDFGPVTLQFGVRHCSAKASRDESSIRDSPDSVSSGRRRGEQSPSISTSPQYPRPATGAASGGSGVPSAFHLSTCFPSSSACETRPQLRVKRHSPLAPSLRSGNGGGNDECHC